MCFVGNNLPHFNGKYFRRRNSLSPLIPQFAVLLSTCEPTGYEYDKQSKNNSNRIWCSILRDKIECSRISIRILHYVVLILAILPWSISNHSSVNLYFQKMFIELFKFVNYCPEDCARFFLSCMKCYTEAKFFTNIQRKFVQKCNNRSKTFGMISSVVGPIVSKSQCNCFEFQIWELLSDDFFKSL